MSDHYHYGYADERHDHDGDYAEKHHRHYDDESAVWGLREDLGAAKERIRALEDDLRGALERIRALEGQTPQARQLQLEADQAAADLAESGYGRHGRDCRCSYCATDEDWPEERGVSEYNREEFALDRGGEPR